jgi:hypothetical protein
MSKPRSIDELRRSLTANGMTGARIDEYIAGLDGQPPDVVAGVLAPDSDRSPNSRLRKALPNGDEKSVTFGETDDSGAVEVIAEAPDDVVENVCRREPNDDREIDVVDEVAAPIFGPMLGRGLDVARCTDPKSAIATRFVGLGVLAGQLSQSEAAKILGCSEANVAQSAAWWREWLGVEFRTLAAHSPKSRIKMAEKARERWRCIREKRTLPIGSPPAAFENEPSSSGFNKNAGRINQSAEVAA